MGVLFVWALLPSPTRTASRAPSPAGLPSGC